MTWKSFFLQFTGVSITLALILVGLRGSTKLASYLDLGWITWVVFMLITIALYALGSKAAVSNDRNAFLQVAILSMVGKMMLAFFIAILYYQFKTPEDKLFILPLFIIYFGFTIFETYLMMKLGKQPSQKT